MAVANSETLKPKAVEEPVTPVEAPQEAPQQPVKEDLVEVVLSEQFTNIRAESEGGTITYGPGVVKVDRDTADDLIRRQSAYSQMEKDRLEGMKNNPYSNVNVGHVAN